MRWPRLAPLKCSLGHCHPIVIQLSSEVSFVKRHRPPRPRRRGSAACFVSTCRETSCGSKAEVHPPLHLRPVRLESGHRNRGPWRREARSSLSDPRRNYQQSFGCRGDTPNDNQDPDDQAITIPSILPRHSFFGEPRACKFTSARHQHLISELMAHRTTP